MSATVRYKIDVVLQETVTLYFDLPVREGAGPSTYRADAEMLARNGHDGAARTDRGDRRILRCGFAEECGR